MADKIVRTDFYAKRHLEIDTHEPKPTPTGGQRQRREVYFVPTASVLGFLDFLHRRLPRNRTE